MKVLYSSSSGVKGTPPWISLAIGVRDNGTNLIKLSGSPQYVVVFNVFLGAATIYHVQPDDTEHKFDEVGLNPSTSLTYIWQVKTESKAKAYAAAYPFKSGNSPRMQLKTADGVSIIHVSGNGGTYAGIINETTEDRFVIDCTSGLHAIKPGETLITPVTSDLSGLLIKTERVPSYMSYDQLSEAEQVIYIPKSVVYGKTQINSSAVESAWVKADDYIVKGTLTYVPSADKDFHMRDESGNKYKYGTDQFRELIPHLNRGVISGTFQYAPRGSNKIIKYLLVPSLSKGNQKSDLVICNSDDSDIEEDTEANVSTPPDQVASLSRQ
jgi:hypothetical protein